MENLKYYFEVIEIIIDNLFDYVYLEIFEIM